MTASSSPGHVLLLAHAPLASALQACATHVFADAPEFVHAVDVPADEPPEATLQRAQQLAAARAPGAPFLVLADVWGATPSNVAQQLAHSQGWPLLAGVNLPMLLRAIAYRHEAPAAWAQRALDGGHNGLLLHSGTPQA